MRIISWNVNGIRANAKKGCFDWLLNELPDIFCLQETKAHPDQLDEGIRNPVGYYSYFDHSKGRRGYSGVAVFSKAKPDNVEYGLGVPEYDQEGRFLALFFEYFDKSFGIGRDQSEKSKKDDCQIKKLVFINTYFPNGGGGPERLKFKMEYYALFLKYINKLRKKGYEIIFCGDVNTAHKEVDLARPKENENNTGFLSMERAWIDEIISEGYFDVFRHLHPNVKDKYTWWDMKTFARERNVGWRIDYFFVTEKVLQTVTKARILDEIMGSDHCPIDLYIG